MTEDPKIQQKEPRQEKQHIRNPSTGEMMELNTFSGKELFWREANEVKEDS